MIKQIPVAVDNNDTYKHYSSMSTAGTADPKLIHLVGKLLHSKQSDGGESNQGNITMLVQQLCQQHREYQRKNVAQLTRDVQSAVIHWQQHEVNINHPSNITNKVKKRKHRPLPSTLSTVGALVGHEHASDDDKNDEHPKCGYPNIDREDEDDYDRAAVIYDTMVTTTTSMSGNLLNDRLLQIRTLKKPSSVDPIDKSKHATTPPKKSSFRIDVIDSQDEISESFADEDNNKINRVHRPTTDNTVPEVSKEIKESEKSTSKSSSNRKRKLIRHSSSRVDGENKRADLGPQGQTLTSLSFTTPVVRPTERYSDLGGMDHIITTIRQLVEYPITRPELYRHLGVDPPRGVLLRGPPGTYVTNQQAKIVFVRNNL